MRHIIPISGKDSLCTAIVQRTLRPDLAYEYVFCDVKMELPETYQWLDAVEKKMGFAIVRVGKSLEKVIDNREMLPNHQNRFCTREAKIHPLEAWLQGQETTWYMGIRADEEGRTVASTNPSIRYEFPLVTARLDLPAVYGILQRAGVSPPTFFWKLLYDLVLAACDDRLATKIDQLRPWEKAALFAWRSRSNCFQCFYQRQYEWVGLLEHHPDLFQRAEQIEQDYGWKDGWLKRYYWCEGRPLHWIRDNREAILKNRAKDVLRFLATRTPANELDMLATVSCGMFCGK